MSTESCAVGGESFWRSHAHPSGLDCDDGAVFEIATVAFHRRDDLRAMIWCTESDEPYDSRMGKPTDHGQLAEILVESHEDAGFARRAGENLVIARVFLPVPRPNGVVPGVKNRGERVNRDASVKQ